MATMDRLVGGIKEQLAGYLPAPQIHALCRNMGHRFRQRQLAPAVTIQLLCWQILAHVGLAGLRHVAAVKASAPAICQARQALPLRVLMAVVAQVWADLNPGGEVPRWKGHRLMLVDGVVLLTQDTPELAGRLGKSQNQKGLSPAYPQVRLLAVLDHATGLIAKVIALPRNRQEQTCLQRMFQCLTPGDLLLGDRGLVSFAHLALLQAASLAGCFRVSRSYDLEALDRANGGDGPRTARGPAERASGAAGLSGVVARDETAPLDEPPRLDPVALRDRVAPDRLPDRTARLSHPLGLVDHHADRPGGLSGPGPGGTLWPALAGGSVLPGSQTDLETATVYEPESAGRAQGDSRLCLDLQSGAAGDA